MFPILLANLVTQVMTAREAFEPLSAEWDALALDVRDAAILGPLPIESATVFCKMRGNPYVELEHWFAQLLQAQDSDLHRVIQHYQLDISVIAKERWDCRMK